MKRRRFLGGSLASLAALQASALPAKPPSALRLTLLHTNDVHSHLEPKSGGEYAGLGGAAARSAVIRKVRSEHKNVLLLDSGDILQGTPYFNLFHGEPEMKVMSAQGYVASTVGNHDFDAGIERLAELAAKHMNFPFLCSNYDFSNTPMKELTRDWIIVQTEGLRIGLFGLGIKLDGLVPAKSYGETRYLNPLEQARRVASRLRNDERCDFIIGLSHVNLWGVGERQSVTGEPGDHDLIREVPEIDVILSGHNHILLGGAERIERAQAPGYVNQVGWAGTHFGLLQFDVYGRGRRELASSGVLAAA
jgi:5'-nucleotidase